MLEPRLLHRLNDKKARLDALRSLPAGVVARLREQIHLEWIYNSNAIEGSTLTLQETRLILETGLAIGGKSLREHFEVINHREAIAYVETLARDGEPLTPHHVRQIHAKELHPVVLAALAHHRLVSIHPFVDGNGCTARLLMNLLLMRPGYPPTIIERVHRRGYYRAQAQADGGNPKPIVNFVGRAVERTLTLYLEACTPRNAPPADDEAWIPLREAAQGTPYSQEYLSLLARRGRLEAIKRGRNWYTTRKAVLAYQRSVERDGGG